MRLLRRLSWLLSLAVLLAGCEKEENGPGKVCGDNNAVQNLPWLKDWIQQAQTPIGRGCLEAIYLTTFQGEPLFYFYSPCSSCIACHLYDCEGNLVQLTSPEEIQEFFDAHDAKKLIWKWQN